MDSGLWALTVTAATVGLVHTAAGPDHYMPFVMLARANMWRYPRVLAVTLACGLGHVLSSVVLAIVAVVALKEVAKVSGIDELRGQWAAYLLLGFGIAYLVWGWRQARKERRHSHLHVHADGTVHRHQHDHHGSHSHVHAPSRANVFWWLLIIFVLGPCEALIPLTMEAGRQGGGWGAFVVAMVFSLATIGTMVTLVTAGHWGLAWLRLRFLEQHMHVVAGLVIVACASSILWLGL